MIESETLELKKSTSELIYNSEQFPEGYTPTDFIKGAERSIPKNPLLANTLYLSKDITRIFRVIDLAENAGYGFDKMFKGWKHYYSKEPVVTTGLDYYRIEFFFDETTVEKTVEKILELIETDPFITQKDIVENTGLSRRGVEWNLTKLKEKGRIKRIGPDKGGHWAIQKNTK